MTFPPNKRHQQYVMCPEQDCESLVYMSDQNTSMIESIGLHEHPSWKERVEKFYGWFHRSSKTSKDAWTWEEGQHTSKWSGTRGSSKRHQSVPINPADRPNPEEKGFPWRMLEDLDTSMDFLYPEFPDEEKCPVEKSDHLETEQQKLYTQWVEKIIDLDRRTTKDPRLYCAYCDMNNHPRFSCKHAYKHKNPDARHRCTLCAGRHPPFLCPKAQVNGGDAKPNWYKAEYKLAKQESREPDYRWGENVSHGDVDPPTQGSQCPAADPQPQCAEAAMMHGVSRPPASSWQGGCPTVAEHQEFMPPWNLEIQVSARSPGPLASFLRHCNTVDSPHIPSYGRGGTQPADDISNLERHASMENLRELQKYSETLQFEATCCRLWAEGIQDQIMDEQEKVQTWISGMTDELVRLKTIQPAWIHQLQTQSGPPAPPTSMGTSSIQQHQPASSSAASTITVRQASPDAKESVNGVCTAECSISTRNGR